MEVRADMDGRGVIVADISGEVDASTSPDLQRALLDLVALPHDRLAVDFSGVTSLSSSGLRALFRAAAAERERGGELRLFGLTPTVRRVFDISESEGVLTIAASRTEAAGDP